jgi:hypothetical protein
MIETVGLVEPWIYAKLIADENGSTGVADLIDVDSISGTLSAVPLTPPYVTFLMNSTTDIITGAGGARISVESLYVIKAVAAGGSWDDVVALAERIDALFHLPNTVVTLSGGSLSSIRERVISYPEVDEGVQYRHLGGIFRIRASEGH